MLTIATMLWQPNQSSQSFSRCYTPIWADKLCRGFMRHLRQPFRFVCFVDKRYMFEEPVEALPIESNAPDYGCFIEPFKLDGPLIVVGLDTVITGNCDHLADYCYSGDKVALPRAVYKKGTVCNGVALVPPGSRHIYSRWNGENDMEWLRKQDYEVIDNLWPGHVVSYKGHVKNNGVGDARIVFFHGKEKPHEINHPVVAQWY